MNSSLKVLNNSLGFTFVESSSCKSSVFFNQVQQANIILKKTNLLIQEIFKSLRPITHHGFRAHCLCFLDAKKVKKSFLKTQKLENSKKIKKNYKNEHNNLEHLNIYDYPHFLFYEKRLRLQSTSLFNLAYTTQNAK